MKAAATENPRSRQGELGQFLTATPVPDFMASMFGPLPSVVRLLDAGAGAGALTSAFVSRLCVSKGGVRAIEATLSEADSEIVSWPSDSKTPCAKNPNKARRLFSIPIILMAQARSPQAQCHSRQQRDPPWLVPSGQCLLTKHSRAKRSAVASWLHARGSLLKRNAPRWIDSKSLCENLI
jgi:hypothetical protein